MKIIIATRFFEKNPKKIKSSQKKLAEFLNNSSNCNPQATLVAVNTEADKTNAIKHVNSLKLKNVYAFPVIPWGKFVPALNALVSEANKLNADQILFASLEVMLNPEIIKELNKHLDNETLVVGAALSGHSFKKGKNIGDGKTVPWNTMALWNMKFLKINAFPMIGEALFNQRHAGVEELATIATYQQSFPFLKAKLIKIPNIEWKTDNFTSDRLKKHLKKMAAKIKRPDKQIKKLNIKPPRIIHI